MSTQPEALRLAEWFEKGHGGCELEAADELRRLHEVEVAYGVMMKQAESRIAELEQTLGQAVDMLEDAPYMSNKDDYRRYADVMQALRERLTRSGVKNEP
jgi:hypothetical protein